MNQHYRVPRSRIGVTVAEFLVAASVLTVGIAFVAQGTVQIKRLMQDMRHYQLAIDELANQLERITALPGKERKQAIENLQPSKEIQAILGDVLVKAEEICDEDGDRIQLSIHWIRGNPAVPLTLTGWITPSMPLESSLSVRRKPSSSSAFDDIPLKDLERSKIGSQP